MESFNVGNPTKKTVGTKPNVRLVEVSLKRVLTAEISRQ